MSHYQRNKHSRAGNELRAISDTLHRFVWVFTAPSSHVMMVQLHGCVSFRFMKNMICFQEPFIFVCSSQNVNH